MKVYNVLKRVNENTNVVSKSLQHFIEKYILRIKKTEEV